MSESEVREQVFACIVSYVGEHGLAPTIAEISECVGKGGTTVRWHLDKLAEVKKITRVKGRAGGIIVNPPDMWKQS